jgi:uncharacterized protein YbjT (DUF2867 family)
MKTLVVGATGKTGRKLLQLLSQTEHVVTGVIRDRGQAQLIQEYKAIPWLGDLSKEVTDIARGQEAIIFVAGSAGGKDIEGVDYQGLIKTVQSAVMHKTKRFLYISSLNIDKSKEQCLHELDHYYSQLKDEKSQDMYERLKKVENDDNYHNYLRIKKKSEGALIESGLNYTIIRAGRLTEEPLNGKITAVEGSLPKFGIVSRFNIALAFINSLQLDCTYKKIYTIFDGAEDIISAFKKSSGSFK